MPNTVSIVPTYSDQFTMVDNGTSGSAGILSVQDRNTYVLFVQPKYEKLKQGQLPSDVVPSAAETVQLIQSNTIFHDTNQEMTTTPTSHVAYQNWARFGLAVLYTNGNFNGKVEYTYDAFNAQYETHTINLSLSWKFF